MPYALKVEVCMAARCVLLCGVTKNVCRYVGVRNVRSYVTSTSPVPRKSPRRPKLADPYVDILSSRGRRCVLTHQVLPAKMLVKFRNVEPGYDDIIDAAAKNNESDFEKIYEKAMESVTVLQPAALSADHLHGTTSRDGGYMGKSVYACCLKDAVQHMSEQKQLGTMHGVVKVLQQTPLQVESQLARRVILEARKYYTLSALRTKIAHFEPRRKDLIMKGPESKAAVKKMNLLTHTKCIRNLGTGNTFLPFQPISIACIQQIMQEGNLQQLQRPEAKLKAVVFLSRFEGAFADIAPGFDMDKNVSFLLPATSPLQKTENRQSLEHIPVYFLGDFFDKVIFPPEELWRNSDVISPDDQKFEEILESMQGLESYLYGSSTGEGVEVAEAEAVGLDETDTKPTAKTRDEPNAKSTPNTPGENSTPAKSPQDYLREMRDAFNKTLFLTAAPAAENASKESSTTTANEAGGSVGHAYAVYADDVQAKLSDVKLEDSDKPGSYLPGPPYDPIPFLVALWRLRLWTGEGWDNIQQ